MNKQNALFYRRNTAALTVLTSAIMLGSVSPAHAQAPSTQSEIDDLRAQIAALQGQLDKIQAAQPASPPTATVTTGTPVLIAPKHKPTLGENVDNSYGNVNNRKFSITGLIESRFEDAGSGNHKIFPTGNNASPGISGAYNGSYAGGGSDEGFGVKRARIIMLGQPTDTTSYKIQLDVAGAINTGATAANQQVNVLEAYGTYTPGGQYVPGVKPGDQLRKLTIAAGGFANPFGYILPASPADFVTPERPIAFSENNNIGMWDKQDYDKGLRLTYQPRKIKFTYAAVNGSGRNAEDTTGTVDSILRAQYLSNNNPNTTTSRGLSFSMGSSYYYGHIYQAASTLAGLTNPNEKKQIFGLDAQVKSRQGYFLDGEYEDGLYEKVNLLNAAQTGLSSTYSPGNRARGYYVWAGKDMWLGSTHQHEFTLAADYDAFDRNLSGGSTYDDQNYGLGALYYLDKATRLRLWYTDPIKVAYAPGTPEPAKIDLVTAELLFKF